MAIDLKIVYDALKKAGLDPNKVMEFDVNLALSPELIFKQLKTAGFDPNKVVRYKISINPDIPPKPKRDKHKPKKGGNK